MKKTLFILFILGCIDVRLNAQQLAFTQTPGGIDLTEKGKNIYHYQSETKSLTGKYPRAHYIHPLYGFDGEVLTEDFPGDHFHHRGIFSAWHQIFVNNYRVGDGWDCRNISWEIDELTAVATNDSANLHIVCYWRSDSLDGVKTDPKRFLKEECTIRYHNPGSNTRIFDFSLQFEALKDTVKLGASEDAKHYSGFSTRFVLPNDVRFFDGNTEIIPEMNGNAAGKQITMKGSFGVHKNLEYILEVVYPEKDKQHWILRKEKSMQNIAVPGDGSYIVIVPGKPVTLQYRLYITRKS